MRHHEDWLKAFMDYASYGEAPKHMYFWSGVSALAGALRRKVWIDELYFRWYPNFYIVIVAPPGVVSKSTTASIAHNLLRRVPGINYGPDIVTWPSLVTSFGNAAEGFECDGATHIMSALTLVASEFGNLFDPNDRPMVDLFVSLWDGAPGDFKKETKGSGNDVVTNPWINLIACTTPAWIAGNFPEYLVGGGFTSRCIFVYADKKAKLVAYPSRLALGDMEEKKQKLVDDLTHISKTLAGEYKLTNEAFEWGDAWYKEHDEATYPHLSGDRFGGYLARKQTHVHKLSMILAASSSDHLIITKEHLQIATAMVSDLEQDMMKVFAKIGKSDVSVYTDRLIEYVKSKNSVSYAEMYRYIHVHFPSMRDFEDVMAGCIRAGYLKLTTTSAGQVVSYIKSKESTDE